MVRLSTARQLQHIGVHRSDLPLGARGHGRRCAVYRERALPSKARLGQRVACAGERLLSQLKGVATEHDKHKRRQSSRRLSVLRVSLSYLYARVLEALRSGDPRHDLIPVLSILSGRRFPAGDFVVDQALPVCLDGDWVALVFRGDTPVLTLLDAWDIANKAILCEPAFDQRRLRFFANAFNKLCVDVDPSADARVPLPPPPPAEREHWEVERQATAAAPMRMSEPVVAAQEGGVETTAVVSACVHGQYQFVCTTATGTATMMVTPMTQYVAVAVPVSPEGVVAFAEGIVQHFGRDFSTLPVTPRLMSEPMPPLQPIVLMMPAVALSQRGGGGGGCAEFACRKN